MAFGDTLFVVFPFLVFFRTRYAVCMSLAHLRCFVCDYSTTYLGIRPARPRGVRSVAGINALM